jgi:gliding motility-associated-like protein
LRTLKIILFFFSLSIFGYGQEICDNGLDDDLDGLIDLQDTIDCLCDFASPDTTLSSLIQNSSFELRSCCPSTLSQMNCVNNWVQSSTIPTPDYFNTCGTTGIFGAQLPTFPLPGGGAGYVGFYSALNWEENIGTCLASSMIAGTSYTLSIHLAWGRYDSLFNFTLYGTPTCTDLPWSNDSCPVGTGSWIQLATQPIQLSNSGSWANLLVTFTPSININAISFGGPCGGQLTPFSYYYADELILNKTSVFNYPFAQIVDSGNYCQGDLVLKVDFDSLPNSFQWYKDSIAIPGEANSTFTVPNGGLGNYQVKLEYDSGCLITEVFKVDTTIIQFKLDSSGTCPTGLQTGEILVSNVKSGTSPYQFQLNNSSFVNDSSFAGLSSGLYTVTVQDSNGCQGVQTITVDSFPQPIASFLTDSVCFGTPSNFIDQSILSSGSITDLRWSLPGSPSITNTSFTFPTDGNFPVTLTVVSDSGCVDDTTLISVVHPLPNASFTFTPQELYTFNPDVCFINQSTGAISYLWDFDFTGINGTSTLSDPCAIRFPTNQEKVYQVTLVAETEFGCTDSATSNVSILDEFLIYIPSAFSPNNDGLNDEFIITTAGVQSLSFQLFNRWGEQVFNSTETNPTWDGTQNGIEVQQGVYVYRATVKGQNGVVKELFGHVNLVK